MGHDGIADQSKIDNIKTFYLRYIKGFADSLQKAPVTSRILSEPHFLRVTAVIIARKYNTQFRKNAHYKPPAIKTLLRRPSVMLIWYANVFGEIDQYVHSHLPDSRGTKIYNMVISLYLPIRRPAIPYYITVTGRERCKNPANCQKANKGCLRQPLLSTTTMIETSVRLIHFIPKVIHCLSTKIASLLHSLTKTAEFSLDC